MYPNLTEEWEMRPLSSFKELGKVAINRLAENKIITLGDLLALSQKDLQYIPYFGPKSIDQVLRMLKKYNLRIKER